MSASGGRSPFAESTYLAYQQRVRPEVPSFSRSGPSSESVAELLNTIGLSPSTDADGGRLANGLLNRASRAEYRRWEIEKRNGRRREILSPPEPLKEVQRVLLRWLSASGPQPGPMVHGFVPDHSHATHAGKHVGQRVVACIDLEDFFGSVSDLHLWVAFRSPHTGLSTGALHALVWLATVEQLAPDSSIAYPRTWTTRATDLLVQYMEFRTPVSVQVARRIATGGEPQDVTEDEAGVIAAEWGITPNELFLGLSKSIRFDAAWSPASRTSSLLLCLTRGIVRTKSRRRLVADLAADLGLNAWLKDRSKPKTIDSLKKFLEQDLRRRSTAGLLRRPLPPVVPLLASGEYGGVPGSRLDPSGHDDLDGPSPTVRHLPQGAPTSPWLANLAAAGIDAAAAAYGRRWNLRYTRYADDLTFSGDALPPRFVHDIAALVQGEGFRVNRDKIVIRPRHTRQVVTGIVVNDRPSPTGVPRRKLRAMLHRLRQGAEIHVAPGKPIRPNQQRGHLAYWHMVDETRFDWPPEGLREEEEG